jgi:O-antigen/teichoic acid export membrane protein
LGLDRPALRDILVYGWPLLLNGIVIFLSTQGDRIVVGALAGMRDLAGYAAMAAVTGSAAVLFNRICTNLLLPLLSEARDDPGLYVARARTTAAGTFLAVSLFLFPIATLGGPLVFLLFGDGYYTSPLLAAFLTVVASSVVVRSWCNANLLSLGGTRDILMANILRAGGLALAFAALRAGYGIVGVAAGICAGDVAASCLANWRVATRVPAIARTCALLAGALLAGAALLIAVNSRLDPFADPITTLAVVVLTTLPWAAAVLALSRDLRGRIAVVWETARERLGWPAG